MKAITLRSMASSTTFTRSSRIRDFALFEPNPGMESAARALDS